MNRYIIHFLFILLAVSLRAMEQEAAYFVPTLENLNVITSKPFPKDCRSAAPLWNLDQMVKLIDQHRIPNSGMILQQSQTNPERMFLSLFKKGIDLTPQESAQAITLVSRHIARGEHVGDRKLWVGPLHEPINGTGFWLTSKFQKNKVVGKAISFDWPHDEFYDWGQNRHQQCLEFVYNEIAKQNPKQPIILAGTCIGAKVQFDFLCQPNQQHNPQIKAAIFESPWLGLSDLTESIGTQFSGIKHLPYTPEIIYFILSRWFPNYRPERDNLPDRIARYAPLHIPFFIGHRKGDRRFQMHAYWPLCSDSRSANIPMFIWWLSKMKAIPMAT